MKIFVQDEDGKLQETNLRDLIAEKLAKDLFDCKPITIDANRLTDGSGSWVEIENKLDDKIITVTISFDDEGDEITDVNVYLTPIKHIVDHDNTTRLT